MGKRRRRKSAEQPTLFDLPLHSAGQDLDAVESGGAATSAADTPAAESRTAGQGPSILFDGNDGGADDDPQLDLIELEAATAEVPGTETLPVDPPSGDVAEATPAENKAFLGDRLLGGLADLAAQLIAQGSAIAATHSMGIVVTVADWQPFGVLALVFSFLYWVVPLAFWGQTPGMAWVGHAARSSNGEPLSFGQTFLRWLGAVITLTFAGLPLLLALTGRSLTDRLSDSRTTST